MNEERRRGARSVRELDVSLLGQAARVDLLTAYHRTRCVLDAAEQRLLHAMATDTRSYPDGVQALDKQWVREDVACALRLSASTAQDRLSFATVLVDRLPDTLQAVDDARISLAHARRLAEAVVALSDDDAQRVEAIVLPKAGMQTLAQFVAACARAVIEVDSRSAEQRENAARRDRRVVVAPLPDGMAQLLAILPAADAWAIKHILDTAAYATADQDDAAPETPAAGTRLSDPAGGAATDAADAGGARRTADQRRADALVDLVLAGQRLLHERPDSTGGVEAADDEAGDGADDVTSGADDGLTPAQQRDSRRAAARRRRRVLRRGPLFDVTVAASTLAGADDQPADLAGYGPITAATARHLAADPTARFRELTVDLSGRLLDVGRACYRPPAHIDRHVRIESGTCYFPGCRRRAVYCELDHCRAWRDGGTTSVGNLEPACARHHHLKHDAGWQVTRLPDRSWRWTSPTGHSYNRPSPDHLPVDRPPPTAAPMPDHDPPPF